MHIQDIYIEYMHRKVSFIFIDLKPNKIFDR